MTETVANTIEATADLKAKSEELADEGAKGDAPAADAATKGATNENSTEAVADSGAAPVSSFAPKGCRKPNFEKDVVYLYQFSRTPTIASVSPFCLKVETWLRLAGLKYEVSNLHLSYHRLSGAGAMGLRPSIIHSLIIP